MQLMSFTSEADAGLGCDQSLTFRPFGSWKRLKAGDLVMGCRKTRGVKSDDIERVGVIRIISVRIVQLNMVRHSDLVSHGVASWTVKRFIEECCARFGCEEHWPVLRIEFEFLGKEPAEGPSS